jgi:hypothetical protein
VSRTRVVNYTNGIYKKVNHKRGINLDSIPTIVPVQMEAMRAHLAHAKFDALIGENASLLPSSVYGHYENFTQRLLNSKEVDNPNKPLNGRLRKNIALS